MNRLWFKCEACGASSDIPTPPETLDLIRAQILPRCKCRKCGHVGADDMRRYFDAGVNALSDQRRE